MKRNAYFRLIHKADGIFLQSFASQEGGKELSVDDVTWYLDQKKYAENVSSVEVQDFVQRSVIGQTLLKVSDNSEALPENEMVRITIDPHSYLAKIRLYPSSDKGSRLTEENVLSLLAQNDVHHGILMQNLTLLLKAELYCTDVLIAKAVLPVQGKRASITYHFDVQKTNTPTMKEDGSVDFHRLDMIERVEKGQLLATLTPETAPIPGTDVRGNVIQPAKLTSKQSLLLDSLRRVYAGLFASRGESPYMIGLPRCEIVPCHFSSEANQVGALYACLHTVGRMD